MAKVKIKYCRPRNGNWFYEPTPKMRRFGFRPEPLGSNGPKAWARAEILNAEWDQLRKEAKQGKPAEVQLQRYPAASIGEAWEKMRRTTQWREKPVRTREDWDRGWAYIEPVFASEKFLDVTMDNLSSWRTSISEQVSQGEAFRAMKIWRAFWKIAAALKYCARDADPSLVIKNTAPAGRTETWRREEIIAIAKDAIKRGRYGLAAALAIIWDSMVSPVDARTVRASQMHRDAQGTWFSLTRTKTAAKGVMTLSRRSERLFRWYMDQQFAGVELHPEAILIRRPDGGIYDKNLLAKHFRQSRESIFPGDKRRMMDIRRTGAVEVLAGGGEATQLSTKMANSLSKSSELQATYLPGKVSTVRSIDELREKGRKALDG